MLFSTGIVKIGFIPDNSVTTLRYLNGNCSWILTVSVGRYTIDNVVSVDSEVRLTASPDTGTSEFKCVVNGTVQLHAIITVHGKKLTSYAIP